MQRNDEVVRKVHDIIVISTILWMEVALVQKITTELPILQYVRTTYHQKANIQIACILRQMQSIKNTHAQWHKMFTNILPAIRSCYDVIFYPI